MPHPDEEIIEMFWQCKHCQTRCPGVSGNEDESLKCSHCGAQKSDEEWLMPDDTSSAPAITDVRQLAFAKAGANWRCEYCGCEERNVHGECSVRSANKPITASASHRAVVATTPRDAPMSEEHHYDEPEIVTPIQKHSFGDRVLIAFIVIGLLTGAIALIRWALSPNISEATVTALSWSRTERLYEQHTYSRSDWRSDMRSGAFNTHCEVRLKGHVSCNPHQCNPYTVNVDCNCTGGNTFRCNPSTVYDRCNCTGGGTRRCNPHRGTCRSNGNGTATCPTVWDTCRDPEVCQRCPRTVWETCRHPRVCQRCPETRWRTCYDQCPVNEEYCSYQYNQWDLMSTQPLAGTNHEPHWPGLQVRTNNQRVERDESYSVVLTDREHRWVVTPRNERTFLSYDLRQRYRVEWTKIGTFRVLGRLP